MSRQNVYLAQVNHRYGRSVFLPYSVGLLQAYAQGQPDLNDAYDFKELIFLREPIKDVVGRMDNPAVFAASLYIWNAKYTAALTEAVRWAFPKCLIVLGGPHVPNDVPKTWFWRAAGGDVVIHGEGEETFAEILRHNLLVGGAWLHGTEGYIHNGEIKGAMPEVQGITFKGPWDSPWKTSPRPRLNDLDKLPSPYLTGVFDRLMADPRFTYQMSSETHRGCPYQCTFCDWGSNLLAKVKKFSDERIIAEYEWGAKHQIEMLYNCVAEGTEITSPFGPIPIECLYNCDAIVGWDEDTQQETNNTMLDVVFSGVKDILRIEHEQGYLETTPDHRIYTEQGWKRADELRLGDKVLSRVRKENGSKAQEEQSLLAGMLGTFTGTDQSGTEGPPQRELRSCTRGRSGTHAVEATRTQERDSSERLEYQTQVGLCVDAGQEEPNEPDGFGHQARVFCEPLREDAKILDRSRMGSRSSGESREARKRVRETVDSILSTQGSPVQVLRGLEFLGRLPMPIREDQEPRFCIDATRSSPVESVCREEQTCRTRPRALLAQGHQGRTEGIVRLSRGGMESIHRLGRYSLERSPSGKDSSVCWSTVQAIVPAGRARTYDVIHAIPTHNFFANGILVANCDANYGMFERDVELTRRMVDVKKRTGYPVKFRAAYAKNSGERVFQISKMLNDAGMSKGTTLSFQSLDEGTLVTIKRKNIDMSNFKGLMSRYNQEGIPTYSELIVGMPGETYDTFAAGIDKILDAGQHSGINVYTAELLPNSEMSQPEYREKHGIKSAIVPQLFYHATPGEDPHREYYEIVTATGTLPEGDWLRCQLFSWAVQTLHCLGLVQCVARFLRGYAKVPYRAFYEALLDWGQKNPHSVWGKNLLWAEDFFGGMQHGELNDPVDLRFGNVSWPPEEFGFLKIVTERNWFYRELRRAMGTLDIPKDEIMGEILDDLFRYQQSVLRVPYVEVSAFPQRYDIHGFLNGLGDGQLSATVQGDQPLIGADTRLHSVVHGNVHQNLEDYAREVVWYGRKGGAFLEKNVVVT
jgi:hypothetical protein